MKYEIKLKSNVVNYEVYFIDTDDPSIDIGAIFDGEPSKANLNIEIMRDELNPVEAFSDYPAFCGEEITSFRELEEGE